MVTLKTLIAGVDIFISYRGTMPAVLVAVVVDQPRALSTTTSVDPASEPSLTLSAEGIQKSATNI